MDMNWEEMMKWLKSQIPQIYPEWTDFNPHDPGITILELLAWLWQVQDYHMKQIGDVHRKKYASLLGMNPVPRSPGHTMVTVGEHEDLYVEAGTKFYADHICFETKESQMTAEGVFAGFITGCKEDEFVLSGEWLAQGRGVSIFPFGKKPECGAYFTIELNRSLKENHMYRLFIECLHPLGIKVGAVDGFYPLASVTMEYLADNGWKMADLIRDETYGMIQDGSICFSLPEPMKSQLFQLRFTLNRCEYLIPPCIGRISLAMVEVWQQETVTDILELEGDGFPEQQFDLEERDIVECHLEVWVEDVEIPDKMVRWTQVEDFDSSKPVDLHYMLQEGVLCFGDGFCGMMPEGRIQITKIVRTMGDLGNIKAGTIKQMGNPASQEIQVTNEYDVIDGTRKETVEELFQRFHMEQMIPKRAVTWEDYRIIVLNTPGLFIEDCKVYSLHPEKREIIMAVKPYTQEGCGILNHAYIKNLYSRLEDKRMIGTRLQIVSPEYCQLQITCDVAARAQDEHVRQMVLNTISNWVKQKSFGEGIIYRELFGLVDTLPGIYKVNGLWIYADLKGKRNQHGDVLLSSQGLFHVKDVTCNLVATGEEMR